jgi:antitoxin YefM
MSAIAFTQFRKHLTESVEAVCDTGEPLTVTRADGRDVVIIPAGKWSSMQETEFLMSSPENAARIDAAIADLNAGKGRERKI